MTGKGLGLLAAALVCLLAGLGGCTPGLSEDLPLEEMIRRGDTARWDGDLERARAFYETAVEVYPDRPEGCLRLARLTEGAFDLEGTIGWYEAALKRDPSLTEIWYDLANLVALTDGEEAAEDLLAEAYDRTGDRAFLETDRKTRSFEAGGGWITDLSPLASEEWTGLESLALNTPNVEDYSPLANLTGLRELQIFDSRPRDLSFLSGMERLEHLYLEVTGGGPVSLKPLAGCQSLKWLRLGNRGAITYLEGLEGLVGLEELSLAWTAVTDLSPLAGCTSLKTLDISRTGVTDLSPLRACRDLERLDLGDTQVTDLSPLAGCTCLKVLYLGSADVEDFTPLQDCPLEVIYLGGQSEENVYALSLMLPEAELRAW